MDDSMKVWGLLVLAVTLLAACGCVAPGTQGPLPTPVPPETISHPLIIQINATPHRYSPVMSSTVGIRLTPVNTSGIIPPDALFTWETNFGSFYHWGSPDYRVVELAVPYTGTEDPVYWSYFSMLDEKERRPVFINLTVSEAATGEILASATLRIGWEPPDGFTAVVEGPG